MNNHVYVGRTCGFYSDPDLGITENDNSNITDMIRLYYKNYRMTAFQFQLGDLHDRNSFWSPTLADANMALNIATKHKFYYVVHGKYIYNLCRVNWKWQIDSILNELKAANQFGADVILHQGKNLPELGLSEQDALYVYANQIKQIMTIAQSLGLTNKVILENSAHQGTELGWSVADLSTIHRMLGDTKVGYCWDTCHGFTSGALDSRKPDQLHRWITDWESCIGLDKLSVIHLNDSKSAWCGCHDSHASIGSGHIGSLGLQQFVTALPNVPIICETPTAPNNIKPELDLVRSWKTN